MWLILWEVWFDRAKSKLPSESMVEDNRAEKRFLFDLVKCLSNDRAGKEVVQDEEKHWDLDELVICMIWEANRIPRYSKVPHSLQNININNSVL